MTDVVIGKAAAFPDPGRKVVEVDGTEVGVFCRNGKFTAFENVCPHMGGPVCRGKIIARVEERIADDKTSLGLAFSKDHVNVVCPWHGYEFDIGSGRHQGNPRMRLLPVKIAVVMTASRSLFATPAAPPVASVRSAAPTNASAPL